MKTTKYLFLSTLLISFMVYNGVLASKSSASKLKVMTFNIRYGTADDGDNKWENRKDIFFDVLKNQKADIIGLQEALKFQLDEIKARFPEYEQLGVGREDGKTKGEYSAILYLKKKFKADSTGYFWFSDTPEVPDSRSWGNNVTRICTWVLLKDISTGKSFYYYNLHIDHESQNSREKSAGLLLKRIDGKKNVIITGDFNAGENNRAVKEIIEGGFEDSFRVLHPNEKDVNTYHAFKGTLTGDKIDYIFIRGTFKVNKAEIIRYNKEGKYPSDHFPVTAVLGY